MWDMQINCLVFVLQVSTVTLNLLEASPVFMKNRAGRISTLSVTLIKRNFVCSCSSERSEVGKRSVSRCQRDNATKRVATVRWNDSLVSAVAHRINALILGWHLKIQFSSLSPYEGRVTRKDRRISCDEYVVAREENVFLLSLHCLVICVPWWASNPDTWTGFEILISC